MPVKEFPLYILPLKVLSWQALPTVELDGTQSLDFAQYLEEGVVSVKYGVEFNERSDGAGAVPSVVTGAVNGSIVSFSAPHIPDSLSLYYRLKAQEVAFNHATNVYYSAWTPIEIEMIIPGLLWSFNGMAWSFNGMAWVLTPLNP